MDVSYCVGYEHWPKVLCSDMTFCLHHGEMTWENTQAAAWCLSRESVHLLAWHTCWLVFIVQRECICALMLTPVFLSCCYLTITQRASVLLKAATGLVCYVVHVHMSLHLHTVFVVTLHYITNSLHTLNIRVKLIVKCPPWSLDPGDVCIS